MANLKLYNSISRQIEVFKTLTPHFAGIYICGPTVYAEPHLGHVRGPVVFDLLHRLLKYEGYKVRFVRNITDVGHLLNDADDGDDKIALKARLENLEPMEIAHLYTESYQDMLRNLYVLPASIEPRASGHIIEQIEMISQLLDLKMAYEINGSVYFDVKNYAKDNDYGVLSGRVLDDLIAGAGNEARQLNSQEDKRNAADFALWKKASKEHIMQWSSPWGKGFPGWHIECSAMSHKYLGAQFDIHGGGLDLLFPHHECEIAQSTSCFGTNPAKYWLHHNMVTINGQKMAKSLNNGITVKALFSGIHPLLEKAYQGDVLRFFILQAHYRSTLDFSNDSLQAAEKGLKRLYTTIDSIATLPISEADTANFQSSYSDFYNAIFDDMNTPIAIAALFDIVKKINLVKEGTLLITKNSQDELAKAVIVMLNDILGLYRSKNENSDNESELMNVILGLRESVRSQKNYALSDEIRDSLKNIGYEIKDGKNGAEIIKI